MEQYNEFSPPDAATVAGWKEEFNRLVDDDTKSATTHQQKLKLKALAVGGSHAFDRMLGTGSQTNLETFNDLVGLATGERSRKPAWTRYGQDVIGAARSKTGTSRLRLSRSAALRQRTWFRGKAPAADGHDERPD